MLHQAITEDEILDFLIVLEALEKEFDERSEECSSVYLNVEHIEDIINVEYGWSTPEEGGSDYYTIDLSKMIYQHTESASTVYGSYVNESTNSITSLDAFIDNHFRS